MNVVPFSLHKTPKTHGGSPSEATEQLVAHFDEMAQSHDRWRRKNKLYYQEQTRMLKNLIPPGLKVLELGCPTRDT